MLGIFLIGIALSMDAFSVSLSFGTLDIKKNKIILLPIIIGLMHFIMPLFGLILGNQILNIININPKVIIIFILLYLSFIMFVNRKKDHAINITSYFNIFLLAFSVSMDSFSVGIGFPGLTNNYYLSSFIFTVCSSAFTYLGILIGKYSKKILKNNASLLGAFILLLIAFVNICQILF